MRAIRGEVMSDQFGAPAQPSGQTVMAPPPPPPPGTFASTPPPAQPPRKRPVWLIVLVVAVVAICGVCGCVAAFGLLGNGDDEAIGLAETHYTAAASGVESATVAIGELEASDAGAETQQVLDEAAAAIRAGRDEVAAARAAIETIDDSQGKSDYLASLDAATEALDGLDRVIVYLGTANTMLESLRKAGTAGGAAVDNLNAAIKAGNKSDYAKMKAKARSAASGFDTAADLFAQANDADPTAGLDKAVAYLRKREEQAKLVIVMADHGKAGRTSAYNTAIKKMNALGDAAEKIGEPDIISDPGWAENRMAELTDAVIASAERADALHAQALEELGYTP